MTRSKSWPSGTWCFYCGSSFEIQTDHKVPKIFNGYGKIPACRRCNQSKGTNTPAQWLDRISKSRRSQDKYRWEAIRDWNYGKKNWFAKLVHSRE